LKVATEEIILRTAEGQVYEINPYQDFDSLKDNFKFYIEECLDSLKKCQDAEFVLSKKRQAGEQMELPLLIEES